MSIKARWVGDTMLGHAKCLIALAACDIIIDGGTSRKIFSGKHWRELVGDIMPVALERLSELGLTTPEQQGAVLSGRARACLPKEFGPGYYGGEIKHFLRPSIFSSVSLMANAYSKSETLRPDDIYGAQEKVLVSALGDGPGVYVRENPRLPEQGYVGRSDKIRSREHNNAPHRIVNIFATQTAEAAKVLEGMIHRELERAEGIHFKGKKLTGKFEFYNGTTISEAVSEVMKVAHLRSFFKNNLRETAEKPHYRIPALVTKINMAIHAKQGVSQ